ncbi:hypothetical protein [Flavobacterium turcicum]|uniref:DUF2157 domain-containing protein n=1 Tax=Flavobacterium turcicum TaxID=2764718 RepID=A0ABR7JEF4_9FLAO|nr:hypothetical protein [Flavobacterium turcicum]MBC5862733.1 hypothetical protein [Flavobacterium turcicum]NHL01465.1 hypothetical protein [Flavobacterium turcicum]
MIAHDKILLQNKYLLEEAKALQDTGFISKEHHSNIKIELADFKSNHNLLLRIAFLLLGSFLYSSICGFFALSILQVTGEHLEVLFFVFALIGLAGTEFFARQNYFGHGLDDAFMIGFQICLAATIGIITSGDEFLIAIVVTTSAAFCYLRYLHRSMLLLACVAATASIFYGMLNLGTEIAAILPIVSMVFALLLFLLWNKKLQHTSTFYKFDLDLIRYYSYLLFYLSGNYLVVRELSVVLLEQTIKPGQDIPFAWFFYLFTFIIPFGYIYQGLQQKNKILLWLGLSALAFSIYSIRFYYSVLPLELVLTFGGLFLFGVTYYLIKKLQNQTTGITFKPDRFSNSTPFQAAEIIVSTQLGGAQSNQQTTDSPMEFGGGGYSGGGASGEY